MALARWDDRGYYAMRASTEKAQRYLHRLSRRAEDVLRAAAATALAAAVKGMGVPEFAAAAQAARRAAGEEDDGTAELAAAAARTELEADVARAAAAAAVKADHGSEEAQKARAEAAKAIAKAKAAAAALAAKRRKRKQTAAQAAAAAEAIELGGIKPADGDAAAGGAEGADADGDADDTAERWTATAGKLTQVLSEDKALASALTAAGSAAPTVPGADGAAGASSSSYLPRLPQLAARLTRVIGDSFKPATPGPSANGAEAEAADGGDAGPDMTADELATAAIVRSQELRADVSKGARMRKRQALADFLEALEAQGLSRRQTGVPLHDRDVAAWFKHPEPLAAAALWQCGGGGAAAAAADAAANAAASASWTRADEYYYRAVARLQKLWRASATPHRDLSIAEVAAARRLAESGLYVARRQRDLLGDTGAACAALAKLTAWMQEAAGTAGGSMSQADAAAALAAQKRRLDALALSAAEAVQLLPPCVSPAALPAPAGAARLAAAAGAARAAAAAVGGCKRRLDGALMGCSCALPGTVAAAADGAAAGELVWVTAAAMDVAAANREALARLERELAAATAEGAAADDSTAAGAAWVPALCDLHAAVSAAATESAELLPSPVGPAAAAGAAAAGADASQPPAELVAALESVVRGVLLWAQPQAAAAAAPAASSSGTVAVVTATNELEAALKLPRARELAAAAAASLCQLTAASSSASAGPLLRGTASMLGLAAEALRLRGLRLLGLHRTTAKLAFVSGAVLATLVEEGYCVPDETKEVEGECGVAGECPSVWLADCCSALVPPEIALV